MQCALHMHCILALYLVGGGGGDAVCTRYLVGGHPVSLRPIPEQPEEGKEVRKTS